jgi:hypothetical protein
MDIRNVKPIGTQCVRCHGQANVLIKGWTPDGPTEKSWWICPRCDAANAIMVPGRVVGTAIGTVRTIAKGRRLTSPGGFRRISGNPALTASRPPDR